MNDINYNGKDKQTIESIASSTEEEWQNFRFDFPEDTMPQLLQRAIKSGAPHIVKTIIDSKSIDINQLCEPDVYGSLSPLMLALHANDLEIINLLMNEKTLDLALSLSKFGGLSWANTCSLEVLQRFLEHPQSDLNLQDGNGCALLHEVASDITGTNKLEYLLQQKNCQINIEQNDGTNPLYRAALTGNISAVVLLLQYPVNVNNQNRDNYWSVLHVAAANNYYEIVKKLVIHKAIIINIKDEMLNTPLHIASERGFNQTVACLLKHPSIDINCKNEKGWTALHAAAFSGFQIVVEQLLSCPEIQINFVDQDRQTALHWAVQNGQVRVAKLLASQVGVNLYIKDQIADQTAFDIAQALAYTEIADFLQIEMKKHKQLDQLSPEDNYQAREEVSDTDEPIFPLVPEIIKKT